MNGTHDTTEHEHATADVDPPAGSPPPERLVRRRIVKVLIAADIVLLLAVLVVWLTWGEELRRGPELRGSVPPEGQQLFDLHEIVQLRPRVPQPAELRGSPTLLVVTCYRCRSGEVVGGMVSRLEDEQLPAGTQVIVAGWNGDRNEWIEKWEVSPEVQVSITRHPGAGKRLRQMTDVGPSGIAFLFDPEGTWRSTYHLGQLDVEDIVHDLHVLADE